MSSLLATQTSGSHTERPNSHLTSVYGSEGVPSQQTSFGGQAGHTWFSSGLPTPPTTKDMTGVSVSNNYGSYPPAQSYSNGYGNDKNTHGSLLHKRVPSDSYSNVKQSRNEPAPDPTPVDQNKINAIASYLQIPESVNKSKGSLAEFAAEITCLFWFEDAETLQYAQDLMIDACPDRSLGPDSTPSIGFRKWVTTILSTTQVGKNVILLALMFIYRLKRFNPSVSGKRGSEFRLLTIALMLGNKFLDDNTYTNKTWADVSGIPVTEIHIMEVEFLSNMRYELYASREEWDDWKKLLGKFGSFYEKASRIQSPNTKANLPITPTSQVFNYKLPSPPSIHHTTSATDYSTLPNPLTTLPQLPRSPIRHYPQSGPVSSGGISDRKRSLDSIEGLPPAKRPYYLPPAPLNPSPLSGHAITTPSSANSITTEIYNASRIPQLPVPRIPTTTSSMERQLAPLSLPPSRAMAGVYVPPTTGRNQPITPTSAVLPNSNGHYQPTISPVFDGTRRQHEVGSAHTSPVNLYGPSTPTRPGLSPTYFLTNRSSPYRPVRHVNTLLIPPPSAAMQNPVRNIDYQQMHYQPLGRPATERRSGPVPYLYPDGPQHSNVSTPTVQQYRPF